MSEERTLVNHPQPRTGMDSSSLEADFQQHLKYTLAERIDDSTQWDRYRSLVLTVLDRLHARGLKTQAAQKQGKQVYYLSMEYLIGRMLDNALINLGILDEMKQALKHLELDYDELREAEWDAGLGNGGLGRLAACFLDSMATLGISGMGYGIRFDFGIFYQHIQDGYQIEAPDAWLRYGNPWDIVRPDISYPIQFYGDVVYYQDEEGHVTVKWENTQDVLAVAYDTPIPGYKNDQVNNLRLWKAESQTSLDLDAFNEGDYVNAMKDKNLNENISRVLYPNDKEFKGQELRLKQEYFMVSASLQDIFNRFEKQESDYRKFPDFVAIQCNDTHPNLAIPELMRLLIDMKGLTWDMAWEITRQTISYTNHTLLPEALEKWPVALMRTLLPRHVEIIFEINRRFLKDLAEKTGSDMSELNGYSIIDQGEKPMIQMGFLGVVAAKRVNGVSAVHSDLMKKTIFRKYHELWPEKFVNVTNGVTPRRWIKQCNPHLAEAITDKLGDGWVDNLNELKQLEKYATDTNFQKLIAEIKLENKQRMAEIVLRKNNLELMTNAIYDVHIKRIHEYKRQLLSAFHTIALYNQIKANPKAPFQPRVMIFAGKAAPGYTMAKLHIKFINNLGKMINSDPDTQGKLQCVFVRNYSVSQAEVLIPAADLSEQISTAGKEASGTGNMKFAMNGALTIGTLDGATIEMMEEIGEENMFIFGMNVDEVRDLRISGYNPQEYIDASPTLTQIMTQLESGFFSPDEPELFAPIYHALVTQGDYFMVLADFESYYAAQKRVEGLYKSPSDWCQKAILNIANMGKFSSDRTIKEYARNIWNIPLVI